MLLLCTGKTQQIGPKQLRLVVSSTGDVRMFEPFFDQGIMLPPSSKGLDDTSERTNIAQVVYRNGYCYNADSLYMQLLANFFNLNPSDFDQNQQIDLDCNEDSDCDLDDIDESDVEFNYL